MKNASLFSNKSNTADTPPYETKNRVWGLIRNLALPLGFSIIYPLALYYGLRALGLDAFYALVIGALPIVGFQVFQFAKKRKMIYWACSCWPFWALASPWPLSLEVRGLC